MSKYHKNLENALHMFDLYWKRENHERPLIMARVPNLVDPVPIPAHKSLEQKWMDASFVLDVAQAEFHNTYYAGESIPVFNPNIGSDFMGAILGCNLILSEDTTWSERCINNWDDLKPLLFDCNNKWWKIIEELTQAAISIAGNDFIVGITDIHNGLDAIAAMRGVEEMCLDLYDSPDIIKNVTSQIHDVFVDVIKTSCEFLKPQRGTTNWMGIYHPGLWYVTSCDAAGLLSCEMFEEFVIPQLERELEILDASMFHLDGPDALKHLDRLLEIENLKGVQFSYAANPCSALPYIDVWKKIQNAGKCTILGAAPDEITIFCEQLRPEGVIYFVNCDTLEQADAVILEATKASKKWYATF